jgi:hypothetical protein
MLDVVGERCWLASCGPFVTLVLNVDIDRFIISESFVSSGGSNLL